MLDGFYIWFCELHIGAVGSLCNIEQDLGVIMSTTTKADFKVFQTECEKWINIFGLHDWEIGFRHEDFRELNRAECYLDLDGRISTIRLNKDWTIDNDGNIDEVTDLKLKKTAFHEVCEILIAPLSINSRMRFIRECEIESSEHYIIMTLENVLFPKY